MVASTCPVCKEEEDREHYVYECKVGAQLRKKVARRVGRANGLISREEWVLGTNMEIELKVLVAKARWIHHCPRCKMDHRQCKRMNLETVMQRLDRRMKMIEAL